MPETRHGARRDPLGHAARRAAPGMVAGKVRKWHGRLLDVDLPKLTAEITASRDRLCVAAKVPQNLFSDQ